jgi:hypothetical protein
LALGDNYVKACTFPLSPLRKNLSVVVQYDFFAQCQPDTRAGICILFVQTLKNLEYLVGIFLAKSNTIIAENNFMENQALVKLVMGRCFLGIQLPRGHPDFRALPGRREL